MLLQEGSAAPPPIQAADHQSIAVTRERSDTDGDWGEMSGAWEWQFAVVFGLVPEDDDGSDDQDVDGSDDEGVSLKTQKAKIRAKDALQELVENWCVSFHKWHFEVAIAERTNQTKDRIIVLLRMETEHVEKYFRELEIERWQKSADGIMLPSKSELAEMDMKALKKQARALGVSEQQLEDAENALKTRQSAGSNQEEAIKSAVIQLILDSPRSAVGVVDMKVQDRVATMAYVLS